MMNVTILSEKMRNEDIAAISLLSINLLDTRLIYVRSIRRSLGTADTSGFDSGREIGFPLRLERHLVKLAG